MESFTSEWLKRTPNKEASYALFDRHGTEKYTHGSFSLKINLKKECFKIWKTLAVHTAVLCRLSALVMSQLFFWSSLVNGNEDLRKEQTNVAGLTWEAHIHTKHTCWILTEQPYKVVGYFLTANVGMFWFVCLFFTQISVGATFWTHDNCKISLISRLWKDFRQERRKGCQMEMLGHSLCFQANLHLCLGFPLIACDKRWAFHET